MTAAPRTLVAFAIVFLAGFLFCMLLDGIVSHGLWNSMP